MISVNEIHVSMSRRAKEHSISRGAPGRRMGRGIVFSQVGLDFDDPGSQQFPALPPQQDFAQKVTAYYPRITRVERARQGDAELFELYFGTFQFATVRGTITITSR